MQNPRRSGVDTKEEVLFDFFDQKFARSSGPGIFNRVGHFFDRRFAGCGHNGFYLLRLGGYNGFDFRLGNDLSGADNFLVDHRFFS